MSAPASAFPDDWTGAALATRRCQNPVVEVEVSPAADALAVRMHDGTTCVLRAPDVGPLAPGGRAQDAIRDAIEGLPSASEDRSVTTESYQHMAPPAGPVGTVDHLDAGHGWTLVRLMTKQAFVREGAHMGHCLGDAMHYHLAGEEELTGDAIWSLRDRDGVSWATLEVLEGYNGDPAGARLSNVVMAKGPGNRTVRRSVARRLQPLVLAFRAAGRELDFSGETELVMADDGRVMRQDQAPADVVEQSRARHVARVIKLQKPQGEGLREPMQLSREEWRDLLTPEPAEDPSSVVVADGEPRRPHLTELFQMTAGMPNSVVELGRNDDFQTGESSTWAKLRDGTVIECPRLGPRVAPYEAARIVVGLLYERVRTMQPAQETVTLGVDSQDVEQARGMADALRGCQQELREGVTSTLSRRRSDPTEFFHAAGGIIHRPRRVALDTDERPHRRTLDASFGNLWRAEAYQPSPTAGELD